MTYYGSPPPKQKRRMNGGQVALIVILALLTVLCSGLIVAIATQDGSDAASPGAVTASASSVAKAKPKPTPSPKLKTGDVTLTVKIKDKQCFGSAGCNLEYTIDAAVSSTALIPDECDVTYEVKGFDDGTQVHTLTIRNDGVYQQDGFQSGSTSSSAKKLTAKATEVKC